jgi:hypothetical protein
MKMGMGMPIGMTIWGLPALLGGGGPVLTAPAQITGGQWTLTDSPSAGGDKLSLNITALPANGGSAITALQYSLNAGSSWITLAGVGTGARIITVLAAPAVASVIVRAVNVIGDGLASTAKTQLPSVASFIATTPVSTFTVAQDPTAWNFSANADVGQYYDGSKFIIPSMLNITQSGTPSAVSGGYPANGLEENFSMLADGTQGISGKAGATTLQGALGKMPYAAGKNKDVAVSGNIALTAATEKTLFKGLERVGAGLGDWGIMSAYYPVTIVPAAKRPIVGDFRPAVASLDKTSWVNISDITLGGCLNIDISSIMGGTNGVKTYAQTLAYWQRTISFIGIGADPQRIMQVLTDVSSSNYAAELAPLAAWTIAHLYSNANTNPEKIALAAAMMPMGLDIVGQWERGYIGAAGAGQHEFYGHVLAMCYLLTGKQKFRDCFNAVRFNYDQAGWNLNPGTFTRWPDGNRGGQYPFVGPSRNEYYGQSQWEFQGVNTPSLRSGERDQTYIDVSGKGRFMLGILLLAWQQNGAIPAAITLFTNGGLQSDTSVRRGALLHLLDLERSCFPFNYAGYLTGAAVAAYDLVRSYIPVAKMNNFPPHPPLAYAPVAGVNSMSWNLSAVGAAQTDNNGATYYFSSFNNAITGYKIDISQDGVQFVTKGTTASNSIAVVGGLPLWTSAKLQNVNGWGAGTRTWKRVNSQANPDGYLVPTGTPTGAVVCETLPVLKKREYAANLAPILIDATDNMPLGEPIFFGTGYWAGAVTGARTIVPEIGATRTGSFTTAPGLVVPDETVGSYYEARRTDSAQFLRDAITQNGVTVYSPAIQLGTIGAVATDTIIDSHWKYTDFVQYSEVVDSCLANSANINLTKVKRAAFSASVAGASEDDPPIDVADGILYGLKTGTFPKLCMDLGARFPLTIGGIYQLDAYFPIESDNLDGTKAWLGNLAYRLGPAKDTNNYLPGNALVSIPYAGGMRRVGISHVFTATALPCWLSVLVQTGAAGSGGGNPVVDWTFLRRIG